MYVLLRNPKNPLYLFCTCWIVGNRFFLVGGSGVEGDGGDRGEGKVEKDNKGEDMMGGRAFLILGSVDNSTAESKLVWIYNGGRGFFDTESWFIEGNGFSRSYA